MTIYLYNINNMFFSVLCTDRGGVGMNCPPLCTVNPTNHAVLLLVRLRDALSAPDRVLPCFRETHSAFSAPRGVGEDGERGPIAADGRASGEPL